MPGMDPFMLDFLTFRESPPPPLPGDAEVQLRGVAALLGRGVEELPLLPCNTVIPSLVFPPLSCFLRHGPIVYFMPCLVFSHFFFSSDLHCAPVRYKPYFVQVNQKSEAYVVMQEQSSVLA